MVYEVARMDTCHIHTLFLFCYTYAHTYKCIGGGTRGAPGATCPPLNDSPSIGPYCSGPVPHPLSPPPVIAIFLHQWNAYINALTSVVNDSDYNCVTLAHKSIDCITGILSTLSQFNATYLQMDSTNVRFPWVSTSLYTVCCMSKTLAITERS